MRAPLTSTVLLLTAACAFASTACKAKQRELSVTDQAAVFYESRPPLERPVTRAGSVTGIPNLRSATCGQCHTEIYEEWKASPHARAFTNPAFQAQLAEARASEQGDLGWQCVNCHTPAYEQMPQLVAGLNLGEVGRPIYLDNPWYEAHMEEDGVGCATCHVVNGVVHGPWGDSRAPHAVARSEKLLEDRVCTQCHQAEQTLPGHTPSCMFDLAATHDAEAVSGQTCQQCHMPEIERPLMDGLPARKTRRHWFDTRLIPAAK